MSKWIFIAFLFLTFIMSGCPPPGPTGAPGEKLIIDQLSSRRRAMSLMEADVGFMFPNVAYFAGYLQGHAAYSLESGSARLRVVTAGPLGVSMDLLINRGEFLARLPGYPAPLRQEDLIEIFGRNLFVRVPAALAKRPGLFFGGIPEDIGDGWHLRKCLGGRWIIPPDDKKTRYLVRDGGEAIVKRAILHERGVGAVSVDLDGWEKTPQGPLPTRITAWFGGGEIFELKISNWSFGGPLPEGVFKF